MTKQISDLIEDIRFNFNEDDSIILKTYIERIERDQFITDEANKGLGRIIVDLKNDKELLRQRIIKLGYEIQAKDELLTSMCNPPHRGGYE